MNLLKKIFVLLLLINFIFPAIYGQSVKITSKKVTYTRPNPISSLKKNFTINYPVITSGSKKLTKKIQDAISYEKVLLFDLEDELNRSDWLEEGDFTVGYNKNGVLSIYLNFTGIGAHETYFGKNVVIDLKTGKRVTAKNVFTNINELISKIKKLQKDEINDSIKEIKNQSDYSDVDTEKLFEFVDFKRIHLEEFSVNEDGVIFKYNYYFPRIYIMIEPTGNYFLSWKEIKPFIKRGGLLEKFIR